MKKGYIFNCVPCTGTHVNLSGAMELDMVMKYLEKHKGMGAEVLPAYHKPIDGMRRGRDGTMEPHPGVWCVWCVDCSEWHEHGPAFGHRIAHCYDPKSRHYRRGYIIAYAGEWQDCFKRNPPAMKRYCGDCPEPHPCGRKLPPGK